MTKRALIDALADFAYDDHLMLGDDALAYVPRIEKICGKQRAYTGLYCARSPGHTGQCYSRNKSIDFDPQTLEEFEAAVDEDE